MADARSNLILRIVLDIILFLGVFIFPFWLMLILAFVGLLYFRNFYEFIAVFVVLDFLYAAPEKRFGGSVFVLTVVSTIVYFSVNFLKKKTIFSKLQNHVS